MQQRRPTVLLVVTAILVALAVYVVLPGPGVNFTLGSTTINNPLDIRQGLDLSGGLQILLEADVPEGTVIEPESMRVAKEIVESRVNALGLTEPLVQVSGTRRILVELPGITDPEQAIATLKETGLLEFVDMGANPIAVGTIVQTDCLDPSQVDCGNPTGLLPTATAPVPTATAGVTTTSDITSTATTTDTAPVATGPTLHTVMTGVAIANATVRVDTTSRVVIDFALTGEGSRIFGAHTGSHVGQWLGIVLDKQVISAATINSTITDNGTLSGNFTTESANKLALQLRYGSLPVPLKVVQSQEIGATLGKESIRRSAIAGIVGILVVATFMLLYYRLPGAVAVLALAIYAVLTFALFVLIPVTLTLPGIAGFVLSVGVAVDANILIFERMKEELRAGRSLNVAVESGFRRAWPSIRDSNVSTLITCVILYYFGSTFGASIVKGFALTLALGVGVSLFTAILVTRTILHLVLDRVDFSTRHSLFGI
jgi:preprotein translocase subunit SecD